MTSTDTTTGALSKKFADNPAYRANHRRRPGWVKLSAAAAKSGACGECVQIQHETRNAAYSRSKPRERRSFPGDPDSALLLCIGHGEAWRERDREDQRW